MRLRLRCDARGATAVEFALTLPIFLLMVFGIFEGGLLVSTQIRLQHGAEMAARCASVNTTTCNNTSSIQNVAAQQSYGLNPSPSIFAVSAPTCGNQVSAQYQFNFFASDFGIAAITLRASSCYPK